MQASKMEEKAFFYVMSLPALFYVNQGINNCISPSALNTGRRTLPSTAKQFSLRWDRKLSMCTQQGCRMAWEVQGKTSFQPIQTPSEKRGGRTWHAVVLGGSLH